jgi:hypothetical protein
VIFLSRVELRRWPREVNMTAWRAVILVYLFAAGFFCLAFIQVVLLSENNPAYGQLTGAYSVLGLFALVVGTLMWTQGKKIEQLERKLSGQ